MNRCLSLFLIAPALASCSESNHHVFAVEGMADAFCVPNTGYVASPVWFVPKDPPGAELGFSFGGCHRLEPADRESCHLPDEFISADVEPLAERPRQWRQLKGSADFSPALHGADIEFDPTTGRVVMQLEPPEDDTWYVWRRDDRNANVGESRMVDSDMLIATCSDIDSFPRSSGLGREGDYGCERYIQGREFALNYRFVSKQRIPSVDQFERLETILFNQIEQWRCPR